MTYQEEKMQILKEIAYQSRKQVRDYKYGVEPRTLESIFAEASHAIDELVKKWVIGEDGEMGRQEQRTRCGFTQHQNALRASQREVIDKEEE